MQQNSQGFKRGKDGGDMPDLPDLQLKPEVIDFPKPPLSVWQSRGGHSHGPRLPHTALVESRLIYESASKAVGRDL